MLLLINHRYPILGAVLGIVSSAVFIAIGVATDHSALVIMSVLSVALSGVQLVYRQRSRTREAQQ